MQPKSKAPLTSLIKDCDDFFSQMSKEYQTDPLVES